MARLGRWYSIKPHIGRFNVYIQAGAIAPLNANIVVNGITFDEYAWVNNNINAASTVSVGPVDFPAGCEARLVVSCNGTGGQNHSGSAADPGSAWTLIGEESFTGGQDGYAAQFRKAFPSGETRTVTFTLSPALDASNNGIAVKLYLAKSGHDTADPLGASAVGTSVAATVNTPAIIPETTGLAIAVISDWSAPATVTSPDLVEDSGTTSTQFKGSAGYKAITAGVSTSGQFVTPDASESNTVIAELRAASTGQTIPVGQTVETDLAQPLGRLKARSAAQAVETDAAQAVTARKATAAGQPAESDAAQPVGRVHRRTLAEPAETDVAQPVAVRPLKIPVGQAVETDTAASIGRRKARTVGQAAEAEQAQAVTARKVRAVGAAAESDSAQAVSRAHRRSVGQQAETDLAQAVGRRKAAAVGQASESDVAQALAGGPHLVGRVTEADTARPVGRVKQRTLGQAAESDAATAVGRRKQAAAGRATEVDTAAVTGRTHRRTLGQPAETDTAAALGRRHVATLGQAAEQDTARPVTGAGAHIAVGQAVEVDLARPLRVRKFVHRPASGTVARPGSGTVGRAGSGTVPRP